jgi:hypothetical protein
MFAQEIGERLVKQGLNGAVGLGEYDFSEDKLQDSVGIRPPKLND